MGNINWRKKIGQTVNGFLIKDYKRENKRSYVYATCPVCKKDKWIRADSIKSGRIISCGCYNAANNYLKPVDIKGKRIGKLKAIKPTKEKESNGSIIWECQCDCGKTVYIAKSYFLEGRRYSCGCRAKEVAEEQFDKKLGKFIDANCVFGTNINNITRKKLIKSNTSGKTGVYFKQERGKWCAQIEFQGKNYYLGSYLQKEDAIQARETAEKKMFGNFLEWYSENFPEQWERISKNADKRV